MRPGAVADGWQLHGNLKIVTAIVDRPLIEKILTHVDLDPQPAARAPAREPVLHQGG